MYVDESQCVKSKNEGYRAIAERARKKIAALFYKSWLIHKAM
jgi:hypothetical protein